MNCRQCGAPMNLEEGLDFFHCEYCGTYDFPDPNRDGVALMDEVSPYACPVCRKPLAAAIVKGIQILSCPNCRGNLIEQPKMLPILRQVELLDSINEEAVHPQSQSERTRIAICPACQKVMDVYPYGGPGNIMIQGCTRCGLIWLDFGELSRIIRSYAQMYDHPKNELGARKRRIAF